MGMESEEEEGDEDGSDYEGSSEDSQ